MTCTKKTRHWKLVCNRCSTQKKSSYTKSPQGKPFNEDKSQTRSHNIYTIKLKIEMKSFLAMVRFSTYTASFLKEIQVLTMIFPKVGFVAFKILIKTYFEKEMSGYHGCSGRCGVIGKGQSKKWVNKIENGEKKKYENICFSISWTQVHMRLDSQPKTKEQSKVIMELQWKYINLIASKIAFFFIWYSHYKK